MNGLTERLNPTTARIMQQSFGQGTTAVAHYLGVSEVACIY